MNEKIVGRGDDWPAGGKSTRDAAPTARAQNAADLDLSAVVPVAGFSPSLLRRLRPHMVPIDRVVREAVARQVAELEASLEPGQEPTPSEP